MAEGIRSTCPYCGVGCGVRATAARVVGDDQHPANHGRLCSKGSALAETAGLSGRLLEPRIARGPAGWDAALDLVAQRFRRTIEQHGSDAVAFYLSGQLLTEDYYVANKLMKGFIGAANIDTNSRLCMASSVAGHRRAFGEDIVPGCYRDWELADLVVLVGSNAAWCHPVLFQRLLAARERRGTRIVVIDPRRTATAAVADLHLAIRPGTDVRLFNGLLAHLARVGVVDHPYIAAHTVGFEEALQSAEQETPSLASVAEDCGLALADLQLLYAWFAATPHTLTAYSQGVNQSSRGTDKVNAILNCHLATGRIGQPGCGPFSITGQPNAMGGREVGGMAGEVAAHMSFDEPGAVERVGRFWQAARMAKQPGLKAVQLFEAVAEGRIKALWIMATNPAVSLPDAESVRRGLARCDFVVVSDCVAETDTAGFAHVLLPAAAWGEKNGTVTNSERRISRQRPFRAAPGLARPDWWAVTQVARRIGFAAAFPYETPAEIFREHATLSAFENEGRRLFDLGGLADLDDAGYDALEPVQWPVPVVSVRSSRRLLGEGRFPTPDGRARFITVRQAPPAHRPDAERPFVLNTGRLRDQWHTMAQTGAIARLTSHAPEPCLDLHPADAAAGGFAGDDLVQIESAWGKAAARLRLTSDQPRGAAFLPLHWSDTFAADCVVGRLASPAVDPLSGQPELKHTPVSIRRIALQWSGFLISRRRVHPRGFLHWVRVTAEGCHVYELAGLEPAMEAARRCRALLATGPDLELLEYCDAGRGVLRLATVGAQGLEECLFLGPPGSAPPREWLLGLFRTQAPLPPAARFTLLSGRGPAAVEEQGRIVCSCFQVGAKRIRRAVLAEGLCDAAGVGRVLQAGTNCGSCRPEIEEIIAHETLAAAS